MKRILALGLWLSTVVFGWGLLSWGGLGYAQAAPAAELTPATLFAQTCAGCHPGGGNIIRRGKNLQLKALVRNQLDSPAAIAQLITQGKGNMSAYGDRLSPEQIEALADYVLAQAQANWK